MEKLYYSNFDVLGTIKLSPKEVEGLTKFISPIRDENGEKYDETQMSFVTPVRDENGKIKHYISRSNLYYQENLTYTDRRNQHLYLCNLLNDCDKHGKRAFVIAENMLNNSARIFYSESIKKVNGVENEFEIAKCCFLNDCNLVMSILRNEDYQYKYIPLLIGDETTEGRQVELDNKALIDIFARSLVLRNKENTTILNPGLGSLFLGPFIKLEHQRNGEDIDWENIHLSLYAKNRGSVFKNLEKIEELKSSKPAKLRVATGETPISHYMTNPQKYYNKHNNFILLDDNLGTGETSNSISSGLKYEFDCEVDKMAVLLNWVNYAKVYNAEVLGGKSVCGDKSVVKKSKNEFQCLLNKHNSDAYKYARDDISKPDLSDPNLFKSPLNFPDYHVLKAAISAIKAHPEDGSEYENILKEWGYDHCADNDLFICLGITKEVNRMYNIASHIVGGMKILTILKLGRI